MAQAQTRLRHKRGSNMAKIWLKHGSNMAQARLKYGSSMSHAVVELHGAAALFSVHWVRALHLCKCCLAVPLGSYYARFPTKVAALMHLLACMWPCLQPQPSRGHDVLAGVPGLAQPARVGGCGLRLFGALVLGPVGAHELTPGARTGHEGAVRVWERRSPSGLDLSIYRSQALTSWACAQHAHIQTRTVHMSACVVHEPGACRTLRGHCWMGVLRSSIDACCKCYDTPPKFCNTHSQVL